MGNASYFIIIILAINLITGMIALGIQSIDPQSNLLLGNKLFGKGTDVNDNVVVSSLNTNNGVKSYDYNSSMFDTLGSQQNSVLSSGSFLIPDWIGAGWKYMLSAGKTYINFIGAPYTILANIGIDLELSALIGSFFGIFGSFIFLNWLLGRDN